MSLEVPNGPNFKSSLHEHLTEDWYSGLRSKAFRIEGSSLRRFRSCKAALHPDRVARKISKLRLIFASLPVSGMDSEICILLKLAFDRQITGDAGKGLGRSAWIICASGSSGSEELCFKDAINKLSDSSLSVGECPGARSLHCNLCQ